MRIPSSVYKGPVNVESTGPEAVGKGVDAKKLDGKLDNSAKSGDVETRVHVSRKALQLATDNAIDVAKIERLRSVLDAGNFRVDARAIAARIVNGD